MAAHRRAMPQAAPPRGAVVRWLVIAFIAFHVTAIALFSIPLNGFAPLRGVIAPYMRCMGLNESWDTFAPTPPNAEEWVKAIVIAPGHKIQVYSFPRMEELSILQRYQKERYRKFLESVMCAQCSGLWPDIAREVVRRTTGTVDEPTHVMLIRYLSPVNPKTGAVGDDAHATSTVLFDQTIGPESGH